MADPRRHGAARSEFRHDSKIDKGHLEFRTLARVDKVAVRKHGGAATDRGAVDRRDQWLVEVDQCVHEAGLWRFAWPWRILEKILDIVARAERISRAVPKDDLHDLVIRRLAEDTCESYVHGRRHRIPLGRAVQLHARMLPTSSVTISSIVIVDVLVPW